MEKPIIGITMGDAAGIGPEITVKALSQPHLYEHGNPLVFGDAKVIENILRLCNLELKVNPIEDPDHALFRYGTIDVVDYDDIDLDQVEFGKVNKMCGLGAVKYTLEAGKMAMQNRIAAIVSAPLHKESMRIAGYHYEGQTEILGEITKSQNYGMLLVLNDLRFMMYSNHMSLMDACKAITHQGILKKIQLANEGLKFFDLKHPSIAVAALNPHAGEGGLFGREEIDIITPAVEQARKMGINVIGPIPADTVFVKANKGEYDLVLCLYHDQANIAMKLLGFGNVVTLLAGLPIIRTSTGHGTAFDIAGKNIADPNNLIKAIELATDLGAKRIKSEVS
jgi:4-hydroxythreonine-4-phosphate dehydrogenase